MALLVTLGKCPAQHCIKTDRAFGACRRWENALWGVPAGKGAFHAVGAAAYAYRYAIILSLAKAIK